MHLRRFSLIAFALTLTGYGCDADNHNGATHPVAYMNITPDITEEGFVQIYVVTANVSVVHITSDSGLNDFDAVSSSLGTFYNLTKKYNELVTAAATHQGLGHENRLALLISASADVYVFGVKSDQGTTDGFMALPLTTKSTEFFIAAWNCTDDFFAAAQIVTAQADTCVEVYEVHGDQYTRHLSVYLALSHSVYTYPCSRNQDITGFFINATRPITVVAGHSCAFIPDTPSRVFFCDHIVEHIPPISELGLIHIVPPIVGRFADAGYIVRVVSTQVGTIVTWETEDGKTAGTLVVTRGHFVQIFNPLASQPMKVVCSKACLVMLYNTGREAGSRSDPTATDPFMMFIVPLSRFEDRCAFATANFCEVQGNVQLRHNFANTVAIVAKDSDISSIMFDGKAVTAVGAWSSAWGYSYISIPVGHSMHVITTLNANSARVFAAYLYGHSLLTTSSGAYGFTVGYKLEGTYLSDCWQESLKQLEQLQLATMSSDCKQERILSGSAVAQHPAASNPRVLKHSIELAVTVNSVSLTSTCLDRYKRALAADLKDLSRQINEMICNGSMCSYLTGAPGTGVRVNQSAVLSNHYVFAAIDTASLTDAVNFTGSITSIIIKVPYIGILDTTAETFAKCRVEVREYLKPFYNWPRGNALLPTLSGCPAVIFSAPYQFKKRQSVCALST